jgi:hypothetical protein
MKLIPLLDDSVAKVVLHDNQKFCEAVGVTFV